MITASIVLYNQNLEILKKAVDSYLSTPLKKKLYLIDNSSKNILEEYFLHKEIEYIFVGKNIGFGKAHNLVLDKIKSDFHLILNPDVVFNSNVIPNLIYELNNKNEVAFVTPKVVYPNNKIQYICRKHLTFTDLINRKLKISKSSIYKNEYRSHDFNTAFYPEFIHGCFMLFKTVEFKKLNGFDERYFLYAEDADICREIYKVNKKILFFPNEEIIHHHQKGSAKSLKLFIYHLSSVIKYFLKWGF